MPSRGSVFREGDRVGVYVLQAAKGTGGMGTVWEAMGPNGRAVAVKVMHEHFVGDEEPERRFAREYEVGKKVSYRTLVQMYEFGLEGRTPYIVMELAPGKSLRRLIEVGGPFPEGEALAIMEQVARGLDALHAQGITHRDLKSSNIVVDRDLSTKIIDYGIARIHGVETIGRADAFVGSAEYSSPDFYMARRPGPATDVYSAGVVLFELLVGRVPFRGERYTETLKMHAQSPVPRPSAFKPGISAEVDELVFSMLQKSPERRPTAKDVALRCQQLAPRAAGGARPAAGGTPAAPGGAMPLPGRAPVPGAKRRTPMTAGQVIGNVMLIALTIALIGGVVVFVYGAQTQ